MVGTVFVAGDQRNATVAASIARHDPADVVGLHVRASGDVRTQAHVNGNATREPTVEVAHVLRAYAQVRQIRRAGRQELRNGGAVAAPADVGDGATGCADERQAPPRVLTAPLRQDAKIHEPPGHLAAAGRAGAQQHRLAGHDAMLGLVHDELRLAHGIPGGRGKRVPARSDARRRELALDKPDRPLGACGAVHPGPERQQVGPQCLDPLLHG